MNKNLVSLSIFLVITACALPFPEVYRQAPFTLPFVDAPMVEASFWIDRLSEPDRVIMSEAEITAFNRKTARPDVFMIDILNYPRTIGKTKVAAMADSLAGWAKDHARFGHDNSALTEEFFLDIDDNINHAGLPATITVRFGMTVEETDLRVLPTAEIGMEAPSEYEFDQLQESLLAPGTPIAVVSGTKDGRWVLIVSPYAVGWAEAERIGMALSTEEIRAYLSQEPFLVVTGPAVDIFSDRSFEHRAGKLRLGCRIPLFVRSDEAYGVLVPARTFSGRLVFERVYLRGDAPVHEGWLPYTGRNILTVAFSMLDSGYGWGGMLGYWDCSSFVKDVFSVFGMELPRNSGSQAKIGIPLGSFEKGAPIAEKYAVLDGAPPGATLLVMPGHVMIYLGQYGGKYFVIHDLWAYRTKGWWGRSVVNGVGRVAVSDLALGEGGSRGPLAGRISDIVEVR
jgi:hypothetical protein